jgi:Relaxase/Mobilisation nuclease domain
VIIRLLSAGKSFRGLGRYLTHDADRAPTSKRVEWTHTLNLCNDDIGSAIDEMLWTYRAADQLKRAAGIRTGSHPLKNPVKHLSMGWDRSDPQTRDHMIEAVKAYLDHMGWGEHQAAIVCHNDRHPHVHVMLNAVHPATGRALDDGHEWRRSQSFALRYEREQGKIVCQQRLLPEDQREASPTREAWQKMKSAEREFERDEAQRASTPPDYFERHDPATWQAKEWTALRSHQREERDKFFADGKQEFKTLRNAIFREVRTEFRAEWRSYYQAMRGGEDRERLAELKSDILERQNAELEKRRDAACAELRGDRDADYRQLLLEQRMERAELHARQEQGLRSPSLLDAAYAPAPDRSAKDGSAPEPGEARDDSAAQPSDKFRDAARETCDPSPEQSGDTREHSERESFESPNHGRNIGRDGLDIAGGLGLGMIGALAEVTERLFDSFLGPPARRNSQTPKPPDQPKPIGQQDKRAKATEGQIRAAESRAAEAEELERYWRERERRRGRDRD